MNTKIVKAVTKDIQRINISYEEALEVKKNRVLMYNLDYAIALANQMKKIDFEALTLRPTYVKFIKAKELIYGPSVMWSTEFMKQVDNEFVNKYLL